jgi:hypothetical protein
MTVRATSYRLALVGLMVVATGPAACARPTTRAADATPIPGVASPSPVVSPAESAVANLSAAKPSPSRTRTAKPQPGGTLKKPTAGVDGGGARLPASTADGVPTRGAGTFTVAGGGTGLVGAGTTLVTYRVEVENGISFGANPVWTPASFAAAVDQVIAAPRGWTGSGRAPVTDAAQHLTNASWSFQRVSGADYSVQIRLATPDTVDRLCGSMGMQTQGVYSCRYGRTEVINLRRWLRGAPGFPLSVDGYHTMVINHEMGHFLGFDHMQCPGAGRPAPVMQTQTIDLGGCAINQYPYAEDGLLISGPWASS